jgi:hypothetical protein
MTRMDEKLTPADFNLTRAAYSINDFAYASGVGRNSIYKAVSDGDLLITKLGKRSIITAPDGAAFLNRRRAVALAAKANGYSSSCARP